MSKKEVTFMEGLKGCIEYFWDDFVLCVKIIIFALFYIACVLTYIGWDQANGGACYSNACMPYKVLPEFHPQGPCIRQKLDKCLK